MKRSGMSITMKSNCHLFGRLHGSGIFVLLLLSAFVGFSCAGPASFTPSESFRHFDEYNGNVRVYWNNFPNQSYVKLGMIKGTGYLATDTDTIIKAMKKRAAAAGANAIVIIGDRAYRPGSFWSAQPPNEMSAWAIRIR